MTDPNLPTQLREALNVMSRRGRVVELTAFQLAPWDHGRNLPCDDRCVCPVHGTPLLYSPAGDEHACQDVNCRHGHGMEADERPEVCGFLHDQWDGPYKMSRRCIAKAGHTDGGYAYDHGPWESLG